MENCCFLCGKKPNKDYDRARVAWEHAQIAGIPGIECPECFEALYPDDDCYEKVKEALTETAPCRRDHPPPPLAT